MMMDVRFKKIRRILDELCPSRPGIRPKALDIGCSQDPFKAIAPEWMDVVGMDIQGGEGVVEADVNQPFPFPNNDFDLIIAGEIIEHAVDDLFFLRECHRVLKPGGRLILTTPNLLSLKNRFLMLFGKEPRMAYKRYHLHVYTLKEIKRIVSDPYPPRLCLSPSHTHLFNIMSVTSSYILYSTRREPITGRFWEWLADRLPQLGAHFILVCTPQ